MKRTTWTQEKIDKLIEIYEYSNSNKLTHKEISEIIGISISQIRLKVTELGIRKYNLKQHSSDIIKDYLFGIPSTDIAKKYECKSSQSIIGILKNNNIVIKNSKDYPSKTRKYFFKEDFFETIDTEERAYWLGFIYADGCISIQKNKTTRKNITPQGGILSIGLKKSDYSHLEKFTKTLNYNGPIKIKDNQYESSFKNSGVAIIKLCSIKMYNDLVKCGVEERKSFKDIKFPFHIMDEKLYPHFIRGVFDGDGCVDISKDKKVLGFSIYGQKSLIYSMDKILREECCLKPNKISYRDKNHLYGLRYYGTKALLIRDYLYKDATVCLDRKKDLFFSYSGFSQKSKFGGVSSNGYGKWISTIFINKKLITLGIFNTEIEAAKMYDFWAWDFYHDKLKLNFPDNYI